MSFVVDGLSPGWFAAYLGKSASKLAALNARRVVADKANVFPYRISLTDAQPGETLILLNFEHLPAASPYRSRHANRHDSGVPPNAKATVQRPVIECVGPASTAGTHWIRRHVHSPLRGSP